MLSKTESTIDDDAGCFGFDGVVAGGAAAAVFVAKACLSFFFLAAAIVSSTIGVAAGRARDPVGVGCCGVAAGDGVVGC